MIEKIIEYKFSIIIPIYNVEDCVEKCINSIIAQNYTNYELIMVNDGSTDKSLNIIKKYENENIKIFSKDNRGAASARNYGLKKATGDFIWFIDSDDYICEDALDKLNKYINKNKSDVIIFKYYMQKGENITIHKDTVNLKLEENLPLFSINLWSKVFDRKFLIDNKLYLKEGIIYEDLEITPYILCKAKSVSFYEEPLYYYVNRNGSVSHQKKFNTNRDDKFIVIDSLIDRFKKDGMYEKYKEQLTYIAIVNYILRTTVELLGFDKKIYKPRFSKIQTKLYEIDNNWYKNKYIKRLPKKHQLYIYMFKIKAYLICKIIVMYRNNKNN